VPHILAIGDLGGQPMLAHKAVQEVHVCSQFKAPGSAGGYLGIVNK